MTAEQSQLPDTGKRRRRRSTTVREFSAGGIVVDNVGEGLARVAVIGRPGRDGRLQWSLPKGHIEPGESAEQAAVREIAEETGITGTVLAALGRIKYWFRAGDRIVLKTVQHYLLQYHDGTLSAEDHEVSEVAWVPFEELSQKLAYRDERRLAAEAADLLAQLRANGSAALPPLPNSPIRRRRQTHLRGGRTP